jgi:hypothetical protein
MAEPCLRLVVNSLPIKKITAPIIHAPHFTKEAGVVSEDEPKVPSGLPVGSSVYREISLWKS